MPKQNSNVNKYMSIINFTISHLKTNKMKNYYSKLLWVLVLVFGISTTMNAQPGQGKPGEKKEEKAEKSVPEPQESVTQHSIKIEGKNINYTATAATMILKNADDEAIAEFGYVAYTRDGIQELGTRPVTFAYNGGPGSASIWLHMGAIGPRRVVVNDPDFNKTGFTLVDNEYSILDVTDIVMIDPVGTGISRAVGKGENKDFWGVEGDISSISNFINAYISKNNRWSSPKYLLGESYGTFRSAGLAPFLLDTYGIALDGIVLVSSVLDLRTITFGGGDDISYPLFLPTYAATAYYHNKITPKPADLEAFLDDAREFALGEYNTALMKGDNLTASEKATVVDKMSKFTGLDKDYLEKADLRVSARAYFVKILEDERETVGRYDSRYIGSTLDPLSTFSMYDPQSAAISPSYQMGFMSYYHNELKFGQDRKYNFSAYSLEGFNWKWERDRRGFLGGGNGRSTVEDLKRAMVQNPAMKVMVENGYYDLATPFLGTEYTFSHLNLPEKLQGNISMNYYKAGHMFYTNVDELVKFRKDVVKFIAGD